MQEYLHIKDKDIPVVIRNYKNAKYLKMYFKADILYISKPKYTSFKKVLEFINENEDYIYTTYMNVKSPLKKWEDGELFSYKGEIYNINCKEVGKNLVGIKFDEEEKNIFLSYPKDISKEDKKLYIDKGIKKILKNNTERMLYTKIPYWSRKTNIDYKEYKVHDATSKFGSCIPSKKIMHFTSRLIMLPEDKVDAIIVHELCHIIHPNHSKDFYNLVKQYIPNYDNIDKWLKENGRIIIF